MSRAETRESMEPVERPYGRFRVETEPMGDGRRIHYYEWPEEDDPVPDEPPAEQGGAADE